MPEGRDGEQAPDAALAAPEAVHSQSGTHAVFISYASQDTAVANAIVEALERNGLRCWIAPRDVRAGAQYADAIVRAISGAKALVLVLSANAIASSHVGKEIERASSKKRRIIALRTDAAPLTPALEYFLSESQWIEAQAGKMEAAYAKLIDAIREPDRPALTDIPVVTPEASARTTPTGHSKSRRNRILLAVGLAAVAVTLAALGAAKFWPAKQVATEQPTTTATAAVSDKSIAVLPFVNMSSDKEQEYFSDGLSEELLNLLAKIPELRVAARTSSFYFKGKDVKLTEVARELQVANILEGSVRKSGNRVRITAQLIRATDGYHQWSETYDRTLEDVFAVQEEIAKSVVSQLKVKLLGTPLAVRKTDPDAYALYLQAVQIDRQLADKYAESIALYEQVLAIDPNYAPAWQGLAGNYFNEAFFGRRPIDRGMKLAREMSEKSLAIDPEYGLAYSRLGLIALFYDQDLTSAARHFERALLLDPNNLDILGGASNLAAALNRLDSDVELAEYLVSRDPMDPWNHRNLAIAYYMAGRQDDAIASSRAALKLSPEMTGASAVIGHALLTKRDYEGSLEAYRSEPDKALSLAGQSMVLHQLGRELESTAALAELTANHGKKWPLAIACVYAHRNEVDEAFDWIDRAVEYRDVSLAGIAVEPFLTLLHKDERWLPMLRKVGRAPEQLAAIKFELKVPTH